jgi:16S rRNA processing protein RimM
VHRMPEQHLIEFGRIVGAHALRGEVRIRFFGDGPESLLQAEFIWLAESAADPHPRLMEVLGGGTGRGGEVRLALQGVATRNEAEALRGRLVLGDASRLALLDPNDFYWHELIGCSVETEAGDAVGRVRELWETGSHDVLVIDGVGGQQVLVPTAREIMKRVDIEARRIVIDAIPGLLEQS